MNTSRLSGAALAALVLAVGCDPAGKIVPKAEGRPEEKEVFKIPLGDSPARGGAEAKVTIVAFSDFQCGFCARASGTLTELTRSYGTDLRLIFKHRPLPFHERAIPAALATEAAREQGKFWEMHDRIFAHQEALDDQTLEGHATALGLDVARWKIVKESAATRARVMADLSIGDQLGVTGTPAFFINGRSLIGAQPMGRFRALIDDELSHGAKREVANEMLVSKKVSKPEPAGARGTCTGPDCAQGAQAPVDDKIYKVELGSSPTRGAGAAPVTVVLFSDFQCPFCKRVEPTLAALEKELPGKVRVVWKHFPLPFHDRARPAALAAQAAGQQGKFWEMHDKLLENQQALDAPALESYARALKLNMTAFKAALVSAEIARAVDADAEQGRSLGVEGTPSMFINGHKVAGALPLSALKPLVEQELARSRTGI